MLAALSVFFLVFFVVELGKQAAPAAFIAAAFVSCQASSGNGEDERQHRPTTITAS